jgi:DNA-binding NarL/FixJ family response regulator
MRQDAVGSTSLRVLVVGRTDVADRLRDPIEAAGHSVWTTPVRGLSDGRAVALAAPDVAIVHIPTEAPDPALAAGSLLTQQHGVPVVVYGDVFPDKLVQRLGGLSPRGVLVSPVADGQLQATLSVSAIGDASPQVPEEFGSVELRNVLERIRDLLVTVGVNHGSVVAADGPDLGDLTRREREVLEAFVRLRRIPDVAEALFISRHTVRNHLKAVYSKLGVHSQPELMVLMLSGRS